MASCIFQLSKKKQQKKALVQCIRTYSLNNYNCNPWSRSLYLSIDPEHRNQKELWPALSVFSSSCFLEHWLGLVDESMFLLDFWIPGLTQKWIKFGHFWQQDDFPTGKISTSIFAEWCTSSPVLESTQWKQVLVATKDLQHPV